MVLTLATSSSVMQTLQRSVPQLKHLTSAFDLLLKMLLQTLQLLGLATIVDCDAQKQCMFLYVCHSTVIVCMLCMVCMSVNEKNLCHECIAISVRVPLCMVCMYVPVGFVPGFWVCMYVQVRDECIYVCDGILWMYCHVCIYVFHCMNASWAAM